MAAETAHEAANWFTPVISTQGWTDSPLVFFGRPEPGRRFRGRRGRDRTCDPQLRRLMLYPTELRPHVPTIFSCRAKEKQWGARVAGSAYICPVEVVRALLHGAQLRETPSNC